MLQEVSGAATNEEITGNMIESKSLAITSLWTP